MTRKRSASLSILMVGKKGGDTMEKKGWMGMAIMVVVVAVGFIVGAMLLNRIPGIKGIVGETA